MGSIASTAVYVKFHMPHYNFAFCEDSIQVSKTSTIYASLFISILCDPKIPISLILLKKRKKMCDKGTRICCCHFIGLGAFDVVWRGSERLRLHEYGFKVRNAPNW